jgi:hypothetical protein
MMPKPGMCGSNVRMWNFPNIESRKSHLFSNKSPSIRLGNKKKNSFHQIFLKLNGQIENMSDEIIRTWNKNKDRIDFSDYCSFIRLESLLIRLRLENEYR